MRPFLGFLVAPLVGVLLPIMLVALGSYQDQTYETGELILLAIPVTVAYASALLFGVPLFVLLRRLDWLRLWQVLIASALCGVPFAVFEFLQTKMIFAPPEQLIRWFGLVLTISTLAGLTFWVIALRKQNEP